MKVIGLTGNIGCGKSTVAGTDIVQAWIDADGDDIPNEATEAEPVNGDAPRSFPIVIGLPEAQAIAHCLVDFPELHNGFADHAECVAFVEANGGYPDSRDAACTDYFEETDS